MDWSEWFSGVSVAMKVESFERETTRVATLTLPNSVLRQLGISSVKRRSSAAVGFHTADFGSTGKLFAGRAFAPLRFDSAGVPVVDGRISVISRSSWFGRFEVLPTQGLRR